MHVNKLGEHPQTFLKASRNLQGMSVSPRADATDIRTDHSLHRSSCRPWRTVLETPQRLGSTDYSNPPYRPSHASSSERRTIWLTFRFTHTFYDLSKPSCGHHPIRRFTCASNSPSWTSRGGCFIRHLIDRFIRTHYTPSNLNYNTPFLNVNTLTQKGA